MSTLQEKYEKLPWSLRLVIFIIFMTVCITFSWDHIKERIYVSKEKPTCALMGKSANGSTLTNALGIKFKIIKIYELDKLEDQENLLVCSGEARFSNGTIMGVKLFWEKDIDGEVFMRIESNLF